MSPGSLDAAFVRRHLAALDEAVTVLRGFAGGGPGRLLANVHDRWAVERGLQVCAQNCIDVATHVAASAGHDVPDYASAIDALGTMGVLPGEFASRFRRIAGFRNLLVHAYLAVDPAIVEQVLDRDLDDFGTFARHVRARLGL